MRIFSLFFWPGMLGLTIAFVGCGDGDYGEYSDVDESAGEDHDEDGHGAHGPHGGHIVELTEDHSYHAEVVFDSENRTLTIYVAGEDLDKPVSADSAHAHLHIGDDESEFEGTADPQENDADGKASKFNIADLPEAIKSEEDLEGEITVTIDGKEYTGEIAHDHDH